MVCLTSCYTIRSVCSFTSVEIFVQVDPSGRLAYQAVPPVLQRFGMNIGENDLISAAQDLKYNGKHNKNFTLSYMTCRHFQLANPSQLDVWYMF